MGSGSKAHIWKPFAFGKCLLFQPLTVIVSGVATDRVQRQEDLRGPPRATWGREHMREQRQKQTASPGSASSSQRLALPPRLRIGGF